MLDNNTGDHVEPCMRGDQRAASRTVTIWEEVGDAGDAISTITLEPDADTIDVSTAWLADHLDGEFEWNDR